LGKLSIVKNEVKEKALEKSEYNGINGFLQEMDLK
jgi:hypothetical protein